MEIWLPRKENLHSICNWLLAYISCIANEQIIYADGYLITNNVADNQRGNAERI